MQSTTLKVHYICHSMAVECFHGTNKFYATAVQKKGLVGYSEQLAEYDPKVCFCCKEG